jgi:hypothetical protein
VVVALSVAAVACDEALLPPTGAPLHEIPLAEPDSSPDEPDSSSDEADSCEPDWIGPSIGPDGKEWLMTAFSYFPLEQTQPTTFDAGYSMYVAAWPFQQTFPGPEFQSGLPSTWMRPNDDENERELYNTIEGGLGWWRDHRFQTETPKFIMGGVSLDFAEWANGPGAGAGSADVDRRDWDTPQGKYGVAQLSPYVLWAPDGLNLDADTNGELFGYGYHPLRLIDAQTTSLGRSVNTGDNSWTLFLNTANFKGPVSFFVPNFFTKPIIDQPELEGVFLDTAGSDYGRTVGFETQVIPAVHAQVDGVSYARITRMQYPATDDVSSVIVHRVTSYDDDALGESVEDWFDRGLSGSAPSGRFASAAAHVSEFNEEAGAEVFMTLIGEDFDDDDEKPVDFAALATVDSSDPTSFRYVWNQDLVTRDGESFVLPEYFRLDSGGPEGQQWTPILESDVPAGSGLQDHVFTELGHRDDSEPFVTPTDPTSVWQSPGPASGPFTAELGDGSTVTYHWYRFVDQPAIQYWGFSDEELDTLQARVEAIHREWTPDRTYLADPEVGDLASLDPAAVVEPPAGMEVGYVPIVTRQELTR